MANNFVQECINSRIYAVEKTLQIFRDKSFANEQKKKSCCLSIPDESITSADFLKGQNEYKTCAACE